MPKKCETARPASSKTGAAAPPPDGEARGESDQGTATAGPEEAAPHDDGGGDDDGLAQAVSRRVYQKRHYGGRAHKHVNAENTCMAVKRKGAAGDGKAPGPDGAENAAGGDARHHETGGGGAAGEACGGCPAGGDPEPGAGEHEIGGGLQAEQRGQ